MEGPLITNDAVVLGILLAILAVVFWTSSSESPFYKRFYTFVPPLLLCYFVPALFGTFGIISGDTSQLYPVASRYLLPTSLVLLTLSIDFKGLARLGPKALVMFLTGTVGVILGGPIAVLVVSAFDPTIVGGDAIWRGLATIAGSWIGGGANQTAMKEVFEADNDVFAAMIAVDVLVANVWMACLLFAAGRAPRIDARTGAETASIDELRREVEEFQASVARVPSLTDLVVLSAVGFGATAIAHLFADLITPAITANAPWLAQFSLTSSFFWIVVIATTLGMIFALTPVRRLEGAGASKVGSLLLYILVATIGMQMNLGAVFTHSRLFIVGLIWISIHALLLVVVAWFIKAPVFYLAVGSQANIGGAASAPIVASAFHPALAPVGVLLAVLGYALGTYGGWLCGQLLRYAAPQ